MADVKYKNKNEMDTLYLLQFACFLFMLVNILILGITRLHMKWMNRRYEVSRWLIIGAMVGLAIQFLMQMLLGFWAPPTPTFIYFLGEVLLDYVLAFTLLGLAGAIAKPFKNRLVGVAVGTAAVCGIRFLCSFLSGVLIWGNLTDGLAAWTYSLTYNGSYMLPETLLTMVAAVLLCRVAPQIFDRQAR